MIKISLEGIELDRLLILQQVKNRQLTQEEAGKRLNVSSRQIRRLMKKFISDGIDGIIFQYKGGNRAFHEDFKQQILAVCSRTECHGFGASGMYLFNRSVVLSLSCSSSNKMATAVNCFVSEAIRNFVEGELWICHSRLA